jgi:large subunit ribosomal protein L25
MSSNTIELKLKPRTKIGKGLKALRREGVVPAVIHYHGKESILAEGQYRDFEVTYSTAGKSQTVNLNLDGKNYLTIIRNVDFDPTKHSIRHIVFQAVKQNEALETEVPIVYADTEIPAEKKSLMVLKELDELLVKALPKDLPEKIEVDLSSLENAGDVVRVESIKAPAGVTIMTAPDTPVAIVEVPKDQIAEADAAAEAIAENADKPAEEAAEAEAKPAEN